MFKFITYGSLLFVFGYFHTIDAQNPWEPYPQKDAAFGTNHQFLVNQTKSLGSKIEIMFFGDGITYEWSTTGKEVWNKYYGNLNAFNYGITGGTQTQHIIWRLRNGEVDGLSPKLVVLMVGSYNLGCK